MKNYSFGKLFLPAAFLVLSFQAQSQSKKQIEKIQSQYNMTKLQSMEKVFSEKATKARNEANLIAKQKGWDIEITTKDGRYLELQKVVDGNPIYYTTFNVDAAKSTRTDHLHDGGSLGLNLMGQSMTAYVWDGGIARASHQEYDGDGGTNRYSVGDDHRTLNFHAAHVTGTIMASGKVAAAKGMAPHAKAIGYQWNNDQPEAIAAAGNGMLISNHSYGFATRDRTGQVQLPQYFFGGYIDESRGWDEIMFNAPNYLMVVAAGNDGGDNTANNAPSGGFGFDKLTGHSTSKNNLVVANAQDANIDANGNLISVAINSSSSEGPTDDFRIKPDITGNGTSVYSSYETSDTAYNSITGTSMASPNVAGTLLILQQHYNNEKSSFMKAATLKGLALHTADDAGALGPDAVFGWGLLNAKRAAQAITDAGSKTKIEELTLAAGQTYTITVDSDGTNPLLASISWTDRPGVANTTVNSTTPVLVNDLDLRVSKTGTTFLPYELTGATTNSKRDNNVDPYERVDVSGASGTYTITVTHKGTLTGGSQNFSLIVTGLTATPAVCNATVPAGVAVSGVTLTNATVAWNEVPAAAYDIRYRPVGATAWTTNTVTTNTATISGLLAATEYQVQVRSTCASGNSNYSAAIRFTTSASPVFCASAINTFPYNEGFESNFGWTQATGDNGDWLRKSGTTPSTTTGPSAAEQGSFYLFLEASDNNSVGQIGANATAVLESDCFDLSGQSAATFNFKNHMYGTDIGSLTVQVTTDGSAWTNVWTASGNKGNQWNSVSIDLAAYLGAPVKLRFVGITGSGWRSDIAIDDLSILTTGTGSEAPAPQNYCASSSNRSSFEWIDNVELGGMTNATGDDGGYKDFTNKVATIAQGSTNQMVVSAGFSDTAYTEFWAVWIDFNQNGTFETNENVVSGSSASAANLTANVVVPVGANLGLTRMRVSMKYNAAQTACETFSDGEVEDYTVRVISNNAANFNTTFAINNAEELGNTGGSKFNLYPNPATNFVQIKLNSKNESETTYRLINIMGQSVQSGIIKKSIIDVSKLNIGLYLLEVNDGQKVFTSKLIKK